MDKTAWLVLVYIVVAPICVGVWLFANRRFGRWLWQYRDVVMLDALWAILIGLTWPLQVVATAACLIVIGIPMAISEGVVWTWNTLLRKPWTAFWRLRIIPRQGP